MAALPSSTSQLVLYINLFSPKVFVNLHLYQEALGPHGLTSAYSILFLPITRGGLYQRVQIHFEPRNLGLTLKLTQKHCINRFDPNFCNTNISGSKFWSDPEFLGQASLLYLNHFSGYHLNSHKRHAKILSKHKIVPKSGSN